MIEIIKKEETLIELVFLICNSDELNLFKVIDITGNEILLLTGQDKFYKLQKDQDLLKPYDIQICQTFIFSKYHCEKSECEKSEDPMDIKLNENSFIYLTKQYTYYKDVFINYSTVLKFIFIYYMEKNIYDTICLNSKNNFTINKKEQYIIFIKIMNIILIKFN